MDFARLPDDVLVKIFELLPLKECIRAGRVNKLFRRIAQIVTSRSKSLDFGSLLRYPRNITPDQMGVILDLCSPNLERVSLDFGYGMDNDMQDQLATKFASYQYPRLTDISVGRAPIEDAVFGQLIRNAPNVEKLDCNDDFVFPDIPMNNLKKLMMLYGHVNDATVQSLTNRCPNLVELEIGFEAVTADVLNQFLASVPQVNRMKIRQTAEPHIVLENLENFRRLNLTSLSIDFQLYPPADQFMHMVSQSFPHLQHLSMDRCDATNDGVAALSKLQELESLDLYKMRTCDTGIRALAKCKKLRKLDIWSSDITGATLTALFRGCPQLEHIGICEIYKVGTPKKASSVMESLSGIPKRAINILIYPYYEGAYERLKRIWNSKAVKNAIKKLEDIEGLKIKIEWGERFY